MEDRGGGGGGVHEVKMLGQEMGIFILDFAMGDEIFVEITRLACLADGTAGAIRGWRYRRFRTDRAVVRVSRIESYYSALDLDDNLWLL